MAKEIVKQLRLVLSEDCYAELHIMSIRKRMDIKDFVTELLEKHVERKKEVITS